MTKNPLYRLYILSAIAFILALLKYSFINFKLSPKFLLVELLSFSFFLMIIFFADKYLKKIEKDKQESSESYKNKEKIYSDRIAELESKITNLESKDRTGLSSEEVDLIADKIVKGLGETQNLNKYAQHLLSQLASFYEVVIGVCYFYSEPSGKFNVISTFGLGSDVEIGEFVKGEGINGQVVSDKKVLVIDEIDEEYFNVESCSGSAKPNYLYLLPIIKGDDCIGLIEIASFGNINIEKYWERINNRIVNTLLI